MPTGMPSDKSRAGIAALVQNCLDAKAADPNADVTKYEAEIDARVEFPCFHQSEALL
jgi:hypothetical protein